MAEPFGIAPGRRQLRPEHGSGCGRLRRTGTFVRFEYNPWREVRCGGSGQAFVSIRTTQLSPFGDGRLFYAGYDSNFYPADGTAWIGTSTLDAIHLDDESKGVTS
jgi:hypothetical protein